MAKTNPDGTYDDPHDDLNSLWGDIRRPRAKKVAPVEQEPTKEPASERDKLVARIDGYSDAAALRARLRSQFGSVEKACVWLQKPNQHLGMLKPAVMVLSGQFPRVLIAFNLDYPPRS